MNITINNDIREKVNDFKIGIIHYKNIVVGESPQMLKGRLRLFQESIYFDLETKQVSDISGIKEWREIFKKIGTDPSRYRSSVEALYRRIQKQNFLSTIHSAADVNNFFSLEYQIPIGIYDVDKISGSISIRIGKEADQYQALNGRDMNMSQKLLSCDEHGPFGSPIVDSTRTAVTTNTKNALQIVYLRPSISIEENMKLLDSLQKMFVQIHGGDSKFTIIT